MGEARFAQRLKPLAANAAGPMPLDKWLSLDRQARLDKTPYLELPQGDRQQRIAVDPAFARVVGERANAWRTLQELAGRVTPFTDRVKAEAAAELAAAHQADLDALRGEYEAKLAALRAGMEAELHARVKGQLMGLAGYRDGES